MAARGWRGKEGEVSVTGLILHLLLLAEKERCFSTNPNFLFFHIDKRIKLNKILKLKCLIPIAQYYFIAWPPSLCATAEAMAARGWRGKEGEVRARERAPSPFLSSQGEEAVH
jgi:hypothetical protein